MPDEIYVPRLQVLYQDKIVPDLAKEFEYSNPMMVPKLQKVVLNMGIGRSSGDFKAIDADRGQRSTVARDDLTRIAGQQAVITHARRAIAAFKLRAGQPVGVMVTLRRARMYEFLDRLVHIALPRIRDFRGFSTRSLDGGGNFSLGIRDHTVFPEIDLDRVGTSTIGFDIAIATTARTDQEAKALLRGFNFPFID